ncbi:MAG: ATP synthase F0 subunit C [Planctomycetaceae bacterium]|nr:ATP synthase F0 subunit C [Planctomycetaceae bacterium]
MTFGALLAMSVPAMAADGGMSTAGLGIGIVVLGAGLGIGKIGGSAVESMARQPEISSQIQTAMIIAAALIEGATFFGILMAYLVG